jgi:AraC-like DNA-binding protein
MSELARAVESRRRTVFSKFGGAFAMPPGEYLARVPLRERLRRLRSGEFTAATVANAVGYISLPSWPPAVLA